MSIPAPPTRFEGTISEFVDRFLIRAIPSGTRLREYNEFLLGYYASEVSIHAVWA